MVYLLYNLNVVQEGVGKTEGRTLLEREKYDDIRGTDLQAE